MRRGYLCMFVALMLVGAVYAGTMERNFTIPPLTVQQQNGYDLLQMEGLPTHGEPGAPVLPFQPVTILLPPGEELVEVRVLDAQWEAAGTLHNLRPGSRMMPLSKLEQQPLEADPAIYNSAEPFPANIVSDVQTGFYRGHGIGNYLLHPVRWHPLSGETERLVSVRVELVTRPTARAQAALENLKTDRGTIAGLSEISADLSNLNQYGDSDLDELDELPGAFLIICDETQEAAWEDFAVFKRERGLSTQIMTTQYIYANYTGVDNAAKVRAAIIDQYNNADVEAVLLGGDVAYVPYRGMYVYESGYEDFNMPSDLYYAGLDGSWNDDGDDRWGEPGEEDLYQEIIIGRAPTNSTAMIQTWINKQILFQSQPVVDEVTQAIMVGEDLGWTAWGGEYKDEIRLGSSNWGYTTEGFPGEWSVGTLYDMNGTWTVPQLFSRLNAGVTYVNHLGHANVTYALKASNGDITTANLTNDGINHNFYLGYTQGCYCGAFEQNSITELWTTIETGAFAFISNSRYGWGSLDNTDGPSQRYDREFFDAIFGEDIYRTGDANRDSKHDLIPRINESCMRWCFYEINLFGDPTVDLYTGAVSAMTPNVPAVYLIGGDGLAVETGEANAVVAISRDGVLLGAAEADVAGDALVDAGMIDPGDLHVVVTAHNRLPYETDITAIYPEGPYPVAQNITVENDPNSNGMADYGESFDLVVEIQNVGTTTITQLQVQVASGSQWLTLDGNPVTIASLAPNETASVSFASDVALDVEDGAVAPVTVTMTSGAGTWEQEMNLGLHAPVLTLELVTVDDEATGNGNHRLDAGETASLDLRITNDGSADLNSAAFSASISDPNLEGLVVNVGTATVAAGSSLDITDAVEISVSAVAPGMERAWVNFILGPANGYEWSAFKSLEIGGVYDDLEGTDQGWVHYANDGWSDQWHVSGDRNRTPGGASSWKMGDTAGGDYGNLDDACLELPVINRDGPVLLSFWNWMDAEISSYWQGECYDGGVVETSDDGVNWTVHDMPGYNYLTRGDTGPLPVGIMVYSGSYDWTYQEVLIEGTGPLYIRFRFGSDQGVSAEGWYLDDISVRLPDDLTPPRNLQADLIGETASLSWNTPGGELNELELLGFTVYRDDQPITGVITETSYDDPLSELPSGYYWYTVSAVYSDGESNAAGPVGVAWGSFTITITPVNPPIVIPAGGGSFQFDAVITNNTASPVTFDAWTEVLLPNGNPYGPLLLRQNLTLDAYGTLAPNTIQQYIPAYAPAGDYSYVAKVGTYPNAVMAMDDFTFTKSATGASTGIDRGWEASGWDNASVTGVAPIPSEFAIDQVYPNPFNPITTVTIALPVSAELKVSVYNVLGREVARLAEGRYTEGYHILTFNADNLASGIYFIRAVVPGGMDEMVKVVLMK